MRQWVCSTTGYASTRSAPDHGDSMASAATARAVRPTWADGCAPCDWWSGSARPDGLVPFRAACEGHEVTMGGRPVMGREASRSVAMRDTGSAQEPAFLF